MHIQIFTILLTLILLTGCHKENDSRLDMWEETLSYSPDSIRMIIESTDVATFSTDYDRARYPLLLMMARDKCYLPLKPDSALKNAAEYFHNKKDLLNEIKARYYAGLAERHVSNYQQALWETLNAIDRAHEAADTFWMGRTHDLAFEIYLATYDPYNAAIEADLAAIFFKQAGAVSFHRYALLEKAQALNMSVHDNGMPIGEGNHLLDSLKTIAIKELDSTLVAGTLYHLFLYSYELKDYNLAHCRLDSIREFSHDSTYINNLLPSIISMSIEEGKDVESLLKLYETKECNKYDSISYLNNRMKLAAARQEWKSAYLYSDSLMRHYDALVGAKSFKSIDNIKESYNKRIISQKLQENKELKYIRNFIIILSISIFLCAIGGAIYIRLQNKRKEMKIMTEIYEIAEENQKLKDQVDNQERMTQEKEAIYNLMQIHEKNLSGEIEALKRQIALQEHNLTKENLSLMKKLTLQENMLTDQDKLHKTEIANKDKQHKAEISEKEKSYEDSLKMLKEQYTSDTRNFIKNRSLLLGNKIDTLCNLAMEYFDTSSPNQTQRNEIYNRVVKQLKVLKSKKFPKELQQQINEMHDQILTRMLEQVKNIRPEDTSWIAMLIAGLQPRTICFLLDFKLHSFYTKRLRVRNYIADSDAAHKEEFLQFFP